MGRARVKRRRKRWADAIFLLFLDDVCSVRVKYIRANQMGDLLQLRERSGRVAFSTTRMRQHYGSSRSSCDSNASSGFQQKRPNNGLQHVVSVSAARLVIRSFF